MTPDHLIQEDLLGVLFGQLSKLRQKPTEAALRQLAECNSNIIQIDELELDKNRKRVLELLGKSQRPSDGCGVFF